MATVFPTKVPQAFANIGIREHSVMEATIAAATADRTTPIFRCPSDGVIHSVSFVVGAAAAGHATNTRSIVLANGGAAGTGTTALATRMLTVANALAAGEAILLYEPTTPLAVTRGLLLTCLNQKEGTGIVVPEILWMIQFEGRK